MMTHKLDAISDLIGHGRIGLGMTRSELHDLLGPPNEEGGTSRKYTRPSIYNVLSAHHAGNILEFPSVP
jgi:hypothetical protein